MSLVPDFVTMLTTPPAALPYSAEKLLLWRLNSWMASGFGKGHVDVGVIVAGPVELVVHLPWPGPVNPRRLLAGINTAVTILPAIAIRQIDGPGGEENERLRLTAV